MKTLHVTLPPSSVQQETTRNECRTKMCLLRFAFPTMTNLDFLVQINNKTRNMKFHKKTRDNKISALSLIKTLKNDFVLSSPFFPFFFRRFIVLNFFYSFFPLLFLCKAINYLLFFKLCELLLFHVMIYRQKYLQIGIRWRMHESKIHSKFHRSSFS